MTRILLAAALSTGLGTSLGLDAGLALDAGIVVGSGLDAGVALASSTPFDAGPPAPLVDGGPVVARPAQGIATVTFDGGTNGSSSTVGYAATGIALSGSTALGLDGGQLQVLATICGTADAGLAIPTVPGVLLYQVAYTTSCPAGSPQVALVAEGAAVPDGGYPSWTCACYVPAHGSCTWSQPLVDGGTLATTPPTQWTMPAGSWSGPGCRPKTCVELDGYPSFPPECQ